MLPFTMGICQKNKPRTRRNSWKDREIQLSKQRLTQSFIIGSAREATSTPLKPVNEHPGISLDKT